MQSSFDAGSYRSYRPTPTSAAMLGVQNTRPTADASSLVPKAARHWHAHIGEHTHRTGLLMAAVARDHSLLAGLLLGPGTPWSRGMCLKCVGVRDAPTVSRMHECSHYWSAELPPQSPVHYSHWSARSSNQSFTCMADVSELVGCVAALAARNQAGVVWWMQRTGTGLSTKN